MDTECMDHYEKQLYTVFKTFDVDNEEALSKTAVLDLCNALQLEERGAALVETLFERAPGPSAERVTFAHFRNGLLSVLGAQPSASGAARHPPPPHSDDDSTSREVAPKFVFGSKKYGRRSRPPATLSRVDLPHQDICSPAPDCAAMTNRASREDSELAASSEDNPPTSTSADLDHDRLIDYEQSLALCKNLNMDGIDSRVIQNIYRESSVNEMTVGEFFDRLNTSLTLSIASTCDGADIMEDTIEEADSDDCSEPEGAVSAEAILESWERAGVEQARCLLTELCGGARVRPGPVQRALDLRLRTPAAQPRLYLAATSLARLRASAARRFARAASARADKLRADLADANRRAHHLAQEVDENHARIEASLKTRLKQAEARHAEASRAAAAEWLSERERLTGEVTRLEKEAARAGSEEARLRGELCAASGARDEAVRAAARADERALLAEEGRAAAARRLAERSPEPRAEPAPPPPPLEPLRRELDALRADNKALRDRNDELCALLEAAGRAAAAADPERALVSTACWQDEIGDSKTADEADQSFASIDQKMVTHSEVVKQLQTVLDKVSQVSLKQDEGCESCATLKSIITSIQDKVYELSDSVIYAEPSELKMNLSMDTGVQTDHAELEVDKLNQQLAESYEKHRMEKEKLIDSVKQLETSLEELKAEYEKCEDYWTQKLEDEREMYNEEQRLSDDRLTELFAKISEYEQQFEPKPTSYTLPTIDEKCSLEVQFNDLEDEYQKYKNDTEKQLEIKEKEIDDLKFKINELENRIASNVNGHSNASSPIDYLWNHQGTIQSPFKSEKRDYQNPAFKPTESIDGNVRCLSDSERDNASVNPIQRPLLAARSSSADALGRDDADGPQMINCAELEGQLRQQAQGARPSCAVCMCLEARCRQLAAAARHRQICLETVQQVAMSEGGVLRARLSAAEAAVARLQSRLSAAEGVVPRLQSRLAAADLLVKELFLENCQLAHHQTRPL